MSKKLHESVRKMMEVAFAFIICMLLIRLYEWASVDMKLERPGLHLLEISGLFHDLITSFSISLVVILAGLIPGIFSPKLAYLISIVLFTMTLLLNFAVTQYFIITLLPLSTDLFGYTLRDIQTTVTSSGSLGWFPVIFLIAIFTFYVFWIFRFERINPLHRFGSVAIASVLIIGCLAFFLPIHPERNDYSNEGDFNLTTNKLEYLVTRTVNIAKGSVSQLTIPDSYPFLHPVANHNTLGTHFRAGTTAPHIVIIMVEGLGRDFVGSDAPYSGFTPFLDSLASHSLYWKNGMSNAGRTFGAPPSILGSLPYGTSGIMNYGKDLPDHQTLITLLKPFGYRSTFFYGGNPNFDNLDLFLEHQNIDQFYNQYNFPASFKAGKKLSDWGLEDDDVFSFAYKNLPDDSVPRLDIFLTLTTHEPFKCPDPLLAKVVDEQIDRMPSSPKKRTLRENKSIFECLSYTDRALKHLLKGYSKRKDFNNTIFVITGDHRLIPMASDDPISRFHVPLIIWSPLLVAPQTFTSLAIHSAITPTLLGLLHDQYKLSFPEEMPFISAALLTDTTLQSNLDVALMRTKNSINDYVEGNYLLNENRLYSIKSNMTTVQVMDQVVKDRLSMKLTNFKQKGKYACENNKLDKPKSHLLKNIFHLSSGDLAYLNSQKLQELNSEQQFEKARQLAFKKDYPHSRTILKNLLNFTPNFHDARVLLARTFAWSSQYDSAAYFLHQVLARVPDYEDAWVALSDVEFWRGIPRASLVAAESGLRANSTSINLKVRKARALLDLGRTDEARKIVEPLIHEGSKDEVALYVMRKLKNL